MIFEKFHIRLFLTLHFDRTSGSTIIKANRTVQTAIKYSVIYLTSLPRPNLMFTRFITFDNIATKQTEVNFLAKKTSPSFWLWQNYEISPKPMHT